jgi:hypothetical protein
MELLLQRCTAYRQKGLAKILVTSTPTDDQGPIWRVYLAGDQRKYKVPCPACGVFHVMEWRAFKIDMDLAKRDPAGAVAGAFYECPHCKAHWGDRERFAAIDAGHWEATATASNPLSRTFWFPSWNSKLVNLSYLAAQWIGAQASRTALQDFSNGEEAIAFTHYENMIRDDAFAKLEGAYKEGERWAEMEPYRAAYTSDPRAWVIGGVDVQKGYMVAVFRMFAAGGDSGLLWYGKVSDFGALEVLSAKFAADYVFVDQRYRKREVQEWCYDHTGYVPCEGVKTTARSVFAVNSLDLDEGRRGAGGRVREPRGRGRDGRGRRRGGGARRALSRGAARRVGARDGRPRAQLDAHAAQWRPARE